MSGNLEMPQGKEPNVKPGELIVVNTEEDMCFNKGPDGKLIRVKCPDVIVAKPKESSTPGNIAKLVASKFGAKEFVPRHKIKDLGVGERVLINGENQAGGDHLCYRENPPNSGHFDPVTCPDVIILETKK